MLLLASAVAIDAAVGLPLLLTLTVGCLLVIAADACSMHMARLATAFAAALGEPLLQCWRTHAASAGVTLAAMHRCCRSLMVQAIGDNDSRHRDR